MLESSQYLDVFTPRVCPLLEKVYPEENIEQLIEKLFALIHPYCSQSVEENINKGRENTVILITDGDIPLLRNRIGARRGGRLRDKSISTMKNQCEESNKAKKSSPNR